MWQCEVLEHLQYIPRNMHTVFALLCFVVVIHWLIFPYPSGLLHWHWGNLTIAPVPAKQPWWIWINTSCEFIMKDCITTTKQSTTKPCAFTSWSWMTYVRKNSHIIAQEIWEVVGTGTLKKILWFSSNVPTIWSKKYVHGSGLCYFAKVRYQFIISVTFSLAPLPCCQCRWCNFEEHM